MHVLLDPRQYDTSTSIPLMLYLEAIARHATSIFVHHTAALLLRIRAVGEQHALVTGCLFVFADTARLEPPRNQHSFQKACRSATPVWRTLTCAEALPAGLSSEPRLPEVAVAALALCQLRYESEVAREELTVWDGWYQLRRHGRIRRA